MNRLLIRTLAALTVAGLSGAASAKGCTSGAAVGGIAGHVAGHHAVLGAVAGCAVNHHRNTVKDREAAAAAKPAQPAPQQAVTATPVRQ